MNDVADIGFMRFDGFRQFELDEGALQIMLRVFDLEINISRQIVREEADTQLKSQESDRIK